MRTSHLPKLFTAALTASVLASATASAAPVVDRVFSLPGRPKHLALGADGNVWITLESGGDVARVRPDGTVDRFDSPAISSPIGIVSGPDGQLWVTQSGGVAHFSPADPVAATAVPIAEITTPQTIVSGPQGALWTASADQVLRIGTDGRYRPFRVAGMSARGIAAGGDGELYVADFGNRQIVGLTTDGVASLYPVDDAPQEVAAGPGNQIAATLPSNLIGRFTPPSRTVQNANVPLTDPTGIVFAPDGAYWAANRTDSLTRMTPDGTVTTLGGFARDSNPRHLTVGRDGTLWVGLETTSQVARVTGVVAPPTGGGGTGGGGGGTGGGTTLDTTRPRIDHVAFPLLHVGRSGTLKLDLSEPATVTIRFERRLPGRRKAGRCLAPHRTPHGRRCRRVKLLGVQTRSAVRGANRLSIDGKIGRRTIPVGSYRITLLARDAAGNVSKPVTVTTEVNARPQPGERRGAAL